MASNVTALLDIQDYLVIKLTSDDLREIDSATSKITAQGDRYPEHLLRMSGR